MISAKCTVRVLRMWRLFTRTALQWPEWWPKMQLFWFGSNSGLLALFARHLCNEAPCAICNEGFIAGVAKPIEIVVWSWLNSWSFPGTPGCTRILGVTFAQLARWNPYAEKSPGDLPPPAFKEQGMPGRCLSFLFRFQFKCKVNQSTNPCRRLESKASVRRSLSVSNLVWLDRWKMILWRCMSCLLVLMPVFLRRSFQFDLWCAELSSHSFENGCNKALLPTWSSASTSVSSSQRIV